MDRRRTVPVLEPLTIAVDRLMGRLGSLIDGFGVVMIVISAGLAFMSVVLRYGFGFSSQLIEEISRYTVVYACFLFVGPLLRKHEHISVDVVSQAVPETSGRILSLLKAVVFLWIALLVFRSGWVWVADLHRYQMTVIGGTMPAWLPSLSVPVGLGMAVLFGVGEVLRAVLALIAPDAPAARPITHAESFGQSE
ncbi:MAG: TRAP transporter small permease [Roseovarius sp.]|nr:TRAP transporter small permease [Roseovarius sp.]